MGERERVQVVVCYEVGVVTFLKCWQISPLPGASPQQPFFPALNTDRQQASSSKKTFPAPFFFFLFLFLFFFLCSFLPFCSRHGIGSE